MKIEDPPRSKRYITYSAIQSYQNFIKIFHRFHIKNITKSNSIYQKKKNNKNLITIYYIIYKLYSYTNHLFKTTKFPKQNFPNTVVTPATGALTQTFESPGSHRQCAK